MVEKLDVNRETLDTKDTVSYEQGLHELVDSLRELADQIEMEDILPHQFELREHEPLPGLIAGEVTLTYFIFPEDESDAEQS
jgi:hypothetical protein